VDWEHERLLHALAFPVVAVLATLRMRSDPSHRILAWIFWGETGANVLRLLVDPALDAGPSPYEGWLRIVFYADSAAFLFFVLSAVIGIASYYTRVPGRWLALGWVGTIVAFAIWKEATQQPSIVFHGWAAVVATILGVALVVRSVLAPVERLVRPDTVHAILALLLCNDIVHVTLFEIDGLVDAWPALRGLDLAIYGILLLLYGALFARDWRARWSLRRT
jgi:hypothetical protein